MAEENVVAVTPKVDSSYHRGEDVEKAVAVGVQTNDKFDEAPRRKKFFFWSLTKKQWIIALVSTILVILGVLLLILFLAIIPAIFQKQVDKVELKLNHLDLLKMSGDRSVNTIGSEMSVHVTSDAMAKAKMYETEATLSYQGKPFAKAKLPETKLKKGKYEFDMVVKDETEVLDQTVFRAVSVAVVTEASFTVEVYAKVKIHALGLSYGGLDLKRELTVKGLNHFSDPISKITHISIPKCTAEEYQMATNITLNNFSDIGLDGIGVLNMSVYSDQDYLGQAISTDAPLGIPRGTIPKQFLLTVKKEKEPLAALTKLLQGILAQKAQFYITGNNPYAVTQAVLLDESLAKLNMSVPYTDGLKSITLNFDPSCKDLLALVIPTAPSTNTTTA